MFGSFLSSTSSLGVNATLWETQRYNSPASSNPDVHIDIHTDIGNTKRKISSQNSPAKRHIMKRKKTALDDPEDVSNIIVENSYDPKTVNSVFHTLGNNTSDSPKKKKRRKPQYIDSEVDLMKTEPLRPPLNVSMLLPKNTPSDLQSSKKTAMNKKKMKVKNKSPDTSGIPKQSSAPIKKATSKLPASSAAKMDPSEKYPVLKNYELVERFLKVEFNNNQKGRIRQVMKDILRGSSGTILPDVINSKILAILNSSENLTDTDLRKIRVLYNMLKKSITDIISHPVDFSNDIQKASELIKQVIPKTKVEKLKDRGEKLKKMSQDKSESKEVSPTNKDSKQKSKEMKPKKEKNLTKDSSGSKRYVVFMGNLPVNVSRKQILEHFPDIREYIKDVRIPQLAADKKSAYAYVEFDNAPVYEMALSRHHTMMGNRRINVLYTTPNKKSKISKSEAKAKSAKLMALQKSGQLAGSIPLKRKRSQRRAKARAFQRAAEIQLNSTSVG